MRRKQSKPQYQTGRELVRAYLKSLPADQRERLGSLKAAILAFTESDEFRDACEAVRREADAWCRRYGEPYPFSLEDWIHQAVRAGLSPDRIDAIHSLAELEPYVTGYLQRLADQRGADPAPDEAIGKAEIARRYGVSEKMVYRWARKYKSKFPSPINDGKPHLYSWRAIQAAVLRLEGRSPRTE